MNKISFWKLLNDNKVVIPIIQRDYAQGRIGKEHIREKFLTQIKAALEDRKNSGELDFVYGTTKDDVFYPLDGQQRLTTLWLLHWFIASKAGKLDEAKERLKKFSYETRTSSREFCEKLCEFDISKVSKVSDTIQKQTWFYTAWKQDPTIQSMLRMIEGSEKKDKQGNDFIDGIAECFTDNLDFSKLWNDLAGASCPIKFSKLEINSNELPVSDDLYIKMNARGKILTDFENFKADLISSLSDKDACEYGRLIDNDWTDIFWNKYEINIFDAKWMAFLCRFAVCVYIENESNDCSKTNKSIVDNIKEWSVYKNDTDKSFSYAYKDFRDFKGVFNVGVLNRLNDIFEGWSKLSKLKDFTLDSSWGDKFCFIPSGNENRAISTLTMKTRILFYGTMLFCEKCGELKDYSIDKWNAWKRVMWNLAENTNESSTVDGFVGVMKMFNHLSEGCLDIYNYLHRKGAVLEYNFEQLKEEIKKSEKIRWDAPGSSDWENKIIQAEKYAFFHGAIRFLYTDKNGDVNWGDFKTKFENAEKYFNEKGIKEEFKVLLIKSFVLQCTWKQLYDYNNPIFIFNPDEKTWHRFLCEKRWTGPIHRILMCDDLSCLSPMEEKFDDDENATKFIKPVLESLPYKEIIKDCCNGRFNWWRGWCGWRLAFYPERAWNVMFTIDWSNFSRNKILSALEKEKNIEIDENHKIDGCNSFF